MIMKAATFEVRDAQSKAVKSRHGSYKAARKSAGFSGRFEIGYAGDTGKDPIIVTSAEQTKVRPPAVKS